MYDNEDVVLEISSLNGTTFYTHGPGIDEPLALERNNNYYYYHADGLGSITAISDSARTVVQRYSYSVFGQPRPTTGFRNSYQFTGREWDKETGLYYYRLRYYDPMEGLFISKDPIGFAGGDVNLYRYVQNNPVNFIDPSGLEKLILFPSRRDILSRIIAAYLYPDTPGVLQIHSHGNPNRISGMDASQLAALIQNPSSGWKPGMPIKLFSCNSAKGEDNIARRLSTLLATPAVTGVNTPMYFISDPYEDLLNIGGGYGIPNLNKPGEWRVYSSGNLVGTTNANRPPYPSVLPTGNMILTPYSIPTGI